MAEQKPPTDWVAIETHYRAGHRSLEDIGKEYGVSKGRISQVAKKDGWIRDLAGKIAAKAEAKVQANTAAEAAKQEALNDPAKQKHRRLVESDVVEAVASQHAAAEINQQSDLDRALAVGRHTMIELQELTREDFQQMLIDLGELHDDSGPGPTGAFVRDKTNELYQYIISLEGRVKMLKDLSAAVSVLQTMQRKVLKMDLEAGKTNDVEGMLESIARKRRGG